MKNDWATVRKDEYDELLEEHETLKAKYAALQQHADKLAEALKETERDVLYALYDREISQNYYRRLSDRIDAELTNYETFKTTPPKTEV